MENRDDFFQGLRGLCIILVILIHCMTGIGNKENLAFNYEYWIVFRQLINFPVAIFIFLSGYFIKANQCQKYSFKLFKERGGRLLIPFIIFFILYAIYNVALNGFIRDPAKVILRIISGETLGHLYFILVLVQLTLLTPILFKCIKNKVLHLICLFITPCYLICLYSFQIFYKIQMPLYETFFPAWFIFYYLGICVRQKKYYNQYNINILKALFLVVITFLASIYEGYLLKFLGMTDGFITSQIKFSSFCYAFAMINLFFSIKNSETRQRFPKLFIKLGDASYGIYYIHCFSLGLLTKLLSYIPIVNTVLPIFQLIEASLAILISYSVIVLTRKYIGKEKAKLFFGF